MVVRKGYSNPEALLKVLNVEYEGMRMIDKEAAEFYKDMNVNWAHWPLPLLITSDDTIPTMYNNMRKALDAGDPSMTQTLLDPTNEANPAIRQRIPRLAALDGQTVGLLDISKMRGDIFLDRLEQRFQERGVEVKRYSKPTFTKPAPVDLRQQIAVECNAVVEALAD